MTEVRDTAATGAGPDVGPLARQVMAGGRDAEAEIVRLFARRVRLYGLRHLRDPAAADDLVQHVLLLVIERLRAGAVREPERLDSFVLGVCRMVVRDVRRADLRRAQAGSQLAQEIDRAVTAREIVDFGHLADCVAGLAQRDRAVVALTFYGERTADEIAAELAISTGNVRVIRHRAIGRLRRCLGLAKDGDD